MNESIPRMILTLIVAGAARSGKSSLLQALQQRIATPAGKAALDLASAELLDWLPLDLGVIGGREVILHLYVIPTPTGIDPTRRMILANAVGVIFVADSQAQRLDDNLTALTNLLKELGGQVGQSLIPLVLYYSKQDLPAELILTREELDDFFGPTRAPSFVGDAVRGTMALETLQAVLGPTLRRMSRGNQLEGD